MTLTDEAIRLAVRERYGDIAGRSDQSGESARFEAGGDCGCAPSCCGREAPPTTPTAASTARAIGYSDADLAIAPEGANLGLGCGNPQAIAALEPGQTVLDLGSGAGFDCFLAARAVGPSGTVIGVDMTPAMIAKARANAARGDWPNVEFRLGEIERLPVADRSVDVILSNCVINLSPAKERVFAEAMRVLRPGGRLAISDIVALGGALPSEIVRDLDLHAACVAGASPIESIRASLEDAGFVDIRIEPRPGAEAVLGACAGGAPIAGRVVSADIRARKPG